jgi:hypothetical protein
MKSADLVQHLSKGIESAVRSHHFCVSGALAKIDPGIDVVGLGPVKLPLKPTAAKRLMAECVQAPYGKGTETLVNTRVRNAFELAPKAFALANPHWEQSIQQLLPSIAKSLGLPSHRLEARLYKLLLYGKGGFFLPHRDSEKSDRMVASLIVALPTPFSGGRLTVRHQSDKSAKGSAPTAKASPAQELAGSISSWITTSSPSEPLVFALDHHYTERGLSLDLLKGADRETAALVATAPALALIRLPEPARRIKRLGFDLFFKTICVPFVFLLDFRGHRWVRPVTSSAASRECSNCPAGS